MRISRAADFDSNGIAARGFPLFKSKCNGSRKKIPLDEKDHPREAMKKKDQKFQHFSQDEIAFMLKMRREKDSFRKVAKKLGRGENAAGSIKRFLDRNRHPFPALWKDLDIYEQARWIYERAVARRKIPRKNTKLASNPELKEKVIYYLVEEQASPRDIAYRIEEDLPGQSIAYTTIYNFTKNDRTDLKEHLRQRGKARKQRVKRKGSRFKREKPSKRNISERPPWVEDRSEFGHFEADTIHSCKNGSGYATLSVRELKSRYRWYFIIPNLEAETTLAVLRGFFRQLPEHMRRSLTIDNGSENEHLHRLEGIFPGVKIYYCDPYCAFQRGSIENTNGEYRWYFPKGIDFKDVAYKQVIAVQDKLNRRRMICLNGKSAEMVFQEALANPPLIQLASADTLGVEQKFSQAVDLRFEQSSGLYLPSSTQLDSYFSYTGNTLLNLCSGLTQSEIHCMLGTKIYTLLQPPL